MYPCSRDDADLIVDGVPMRLETVPEYFLAKNMQAWGGKVSLLPGETWDTLAVVLDDRWGQHIWHPCHWENTGGSMLDFHAEERQAQQAELLTDIVEADEQNGGCSSHRSLAYQNAFAVCMALWRGEGSGTVFETLYEHLSAEVAHLTRTGHGAS